MPGAPNQEFGTVLAEINSKLENDGSGLKVAITADVNVDIDESALATAVGQTTTNATLATIDGHVDGLEASATSIDTKLTSQATAARQDTGNTSLGSIDTKLTSQATGTKQDTGNTSLSSIDGKIPAAAAPADAESNATTSTTFRVRLFGFNGTSWDRLKAGLSTVSSTLTGILTTLPWALYHLAPVTRTEGQGGPIETDAIGNLRTADQYAPLYENNADAVASGHDRAVGSATYNAVPYDMVSKAGSGVIKSTPGNLYRVYFTNNSATACGVALVNKATTPANGDTPLMYISVAAWETKLIEFRFGKRFSTGIAWAELAQANLGAATITAVAGTDITVNAEFA